MYYRSTSGSRTWDGNQFWAATKTVDTDISTSTPVSIEMADAGTPGHLDADVHEWGTYTFDVVVIKYKAGVQIDRYGLKEDYCLWVPETGGDGEPGHEWWLVDPGGTLPEIRASYWLNDQGLRDAHEAGIVVVGPDLSERASIAAATEVGQRHEGTDEDGDGEPDGINVYRFGPDDREGEWRLIWTGADECGAHDPGRRTHDRPRMLAANMADETAWRIRYITGTYAGAQWQGAIAQTSSTYRQTRYCREIEPDKLDRSLVKPYVIRALEAPGSEGHASFAVNGGLFNLTGGEIVGAVGVGDGTWPENPILPQRDCFGMDRTGRCAHVARMKTYEEEKEARVWPTIKIRFKYGRSHTGDLLHPDANHGGDIQWPDHSIDRQRTLCCFGTGSKARAYFLCVACPNPGWTWDDTRKFLTEYLAGHLRDTYHIDVQGLTDASMLDGGGSTQFYFQRVVRGMDAEAKDLPPTGGRQVTDLVQGCTKAIPIP